MTEIFTEILAVLQTISRPDKTVSSPEPCYDRANGTAADSAD